MLKEEKVTKAKNNVLEEKENNEWLADRTEMVLEEVEHRMMKLEVYEKDFEKNGTKDQVQNCRNRKNELQRLHDFMIDILSNK